MFTEEQISKALDGHFYALRHDHRGTAVIDLAQGEKLADEDEDALPVMTVRGTNYAKPNSIDWTEKDSTILHMRRAGKTFKEIGAAVSVSKDSVRWRYQRLCDELNIDAGDIQSTAKKYDPMFIAEIVRLRDKGLSFKQIGLRLGVSKPFVCVTYNRWYSANPKEAA